MAADRIPLGDDVVHIGDDGFVANAGAVERGPTSYGTGSLSMGAGTFGSTGTVLPAYPYNSAGDRYPVSPSLESLQVYPIVPETNWSAVYPNNGGIDAWKGVQPDTPHAVTGKPGE
jgi:hypothetical protein